MTAKKTWEKKKYLREQANKLWAEKMMAPEPEFNSFMTYLKSKGLALNNREKPDFIARVLSFHFPGSPEGQFMFAIVMQAIKDSVHKDKEIQRDAIRWLNDEIIPAEVCGIDSEFVREIVTKSGIML